MMTSPDPIELLFGGMEKLGPGSNADTMHVLDLLPDAAHEIVVDAGCGTGRQTMVLVNRLQVPVHVIDNYQPFLDDLQLRAESGGIGHLVRPHCMDMAEIPGAFDGIDLLWSEGAAYNIGFPHALQTWRSALDDRGLAVVSELSWLRDDVPTAVREFFREGYPDMRSTDENRSVAEDAGFDVFDTYTLPGEAWVEGYYDVLAPRALTLLDHADESVRSFAAEMMDEIRVFHQSKGGYGYVFFLMQKA